MDASPKFLIDRRDAVHPVVRFVNGNFAEGGIIPESARFHYMFALAVLGIAESLDEFNAVTYFTNDKRYVAGVIHTYFLDGSQAPVYGLQFYPQDVINERTIVEALREPLHLIVGREDFVLEETTEDVVAQKLAERMSQPLIALSWEPEVELRFYDELAESTPTAALVASRRYGSKAANLGFLARRLVLGRVANAGSPSALKGYDLVPLGFAVPLQYYADFVGHPPNTDLRRGHRQR
jgi:hypothetical protein